MLWFGIKVSLDFINSGQSVLYCWRWSAVSLLNKKRNYKLQNIFVLHSLFLVFCTCSPRGKPCVTKIPDCVLACSYTAILCFLRRRKKQLSKSAVNYLSIQKHKTCFRNGYNLREIEGSVSVRWPWDSRCTATVTLINCRIKKKVAVQLDVSLRPVSRTGYWIE